MHFLFVIWLAGLNAQASFLENWTARPAWPEPISFVSGATLTATSLALRHPLIDNFQKYESERRPLGPWHTYGDLAGQVIPNVLYAGGMLIGAWAGQSGALDHSELMITATLESALISEVIKISVREERPDSHHHTSFPSGHTTTAFAFASVVGVEHGWRWGVPAYLLAGFVGWSRINDNRHYLHDTLAGATIGLSTGLGIYLAREKRKLLGAQIQLRPLPVADGGGILLEAAY